MEGVCALRPDLYRVTRVVTRAPNAGGEEIVAVTRAQFAKSKAEGAFALHWQAHGLSYGIPADVRRVLARGVDVFANLSRGMLKGAQAAFDPLIVLHITASQEFLAQRLALRGREDSAERVRRLARPAPAMPRGLTCIDIDNSGTLDASVKAAIAALYPERG